MDIWILAFMCAMFFVFSLKTESIGGFLIYTTLYAACAATIVVQFTN